MTLELFDYQKFQFPVFEMSILSGFFFQHLQLKIQNHVDQEVQPALHFRSFAGIPFATFENLSNLF